MTNTVNTTNAVNNSDIKKTNSTPIKEDKKLSFGSLKSITLNTTLRTEKEQKKYIEVLNALPQKEKIYLSSLLKNGKLLNNESNDKSTTLDNLHNIINNKRAIGLNTKSILKDVVTAIYNPFEITQRFGDIPKPISKQILANPSAYTTSDSSYTNYLDAILNEGKLPSSQPLTKDLLNVVSSSCVAASIQFNLAHKNPAEYARIAEQLSSDKISATKNIKLTDITQNKTDAIWLLKQFKVPYKLIDSENVSVNMSPDRNAIIRARIQATQEFRDKEERSPIDVLMQSTFMNIGSQHTYNSLTDIRTGSFNPDNRGLTDIEKNLTEVIAQGRNKISATYQILDETGKIIGYECPHQNTLQHIKEALKQGDNVIIGYTHTDNNNRVINGHEITIIGIEKTPNGEVFICNDTDDAKSEPTKYDVSYLLPKIHHAGLPQSALKNDKKIIDNWTSILNQYKEPMPSITV